MTSMTHCNRDAQGFFSLAVAKEHMMVTGMK